MTERRRRRGVALMLVASLWAAACGGSEGVTASETGGEAVASALTGEFETLAGDTVDLAAFAGSDVVLWFWAPW